ncbi:LacI family DNA-binding transcriptional regulator [Jannaschia sp. CCS1]|uniref:LacI family DNA-binding transcriptional regulator n=1 Tax=Jannaschia sp. (strain CCS1) TaxID=290400 RepID=UPI000053A416|nr:LacI family DNA-binding transcriptional regulator [Jannaschia sp. CCS1]ABD54024.1 transcriptional regulator, LacI family [Jannaschia sp. CCS1]
MIDRAPITGKVTSIDVAQRAGVSQSAVSRVFTPGASVSKKMEARVREAADDLGYRPNVLARSLITGRSRIIGLVVAHLDNSFYPDALEKLSAALQAKGYHILVFMAGNSGDDVDSVIHDLMDYQVDGIITASINLSGELTDRCRAAGLPVLLFNRGIEGSGLSSVTSANRIGGAAVANTLLDAGHTKIATISGWMGASTGRDRRDGFVAALEARGAQVHAEADGLYDRDTAARVARDMMQAAHPPDAIFVGNDHMAMAVMDTLRFDLGLSVPDDVSIIGYDDVPMAAWPSYNLTTLRQPVNRMVEATVDTMLDEIETGRAPGTRVEIEGELILRTSARLPKGPTI